MREIKFRAWDKESKEMLYQPLDTLFGLSRFMGFLDEKAILMQFTGLKDKNGKEIYEGDIVRTDEASWKAKVVYEVDTFCCVDNQGGFSFDCHWEKFEIIGNIYENPELVDRG